MTTGLLRCHLDSAGAVPRLQAGDDRCLTSVGVTRQEEQRQRRRDDERDEQLGEDGEHVGQRERTEERASQPFEQEHWDEHQDHDEAAVNDGAAHFHRCIEDDVDCRTWVARGGCAAVFIVVGRADRDRYDVIAKMTK